jgi:hypothetical protein
MSNYSNDLGQIHFVIDISETTSITEGLYNIFSRDLDFIENEEYFRKNTLKKGFDNEADRIVIEYMGKHLISNKKQLEKAVEYMAKQIFGNYNQYQAYDTSVLKISNDLYSVAVSYTF